MATNKLIIDPKLFTQDQWEEAAANDAINLLKTDSHRDAKPVKASKAKIIEFAQDCRAKAVSVTEGDLGSSDESVNIDEWADELIAVAEILERIAGVIPAKRRTRISLDARELATVLAGLRTWQAQGGPQGLGREQTDYINAIATDAGDELTADEIDTLCERINV